MSYKQKSGLLTGGFKTKYFNLEKDTCQGDLISEYLFICTVEIIFLLIKIIPQQRVLKFSTMYMPMIQRFSSKI